MAVENKYSQIATSYDSLNERLSTNYKQLESQYITGQSSAYNSLQKEITETIDLLSNCLFDSSQLLLNYNKSTNSDIDKLSSCIDSIYHNFDTYYRSCSLNNTCITRLDRFNYKLPIKGTLPEKKAPSYCNPFNPSPNLNKKRSAWPNIKPIEEFKMKLEPKQSFDLKILSQKLISQSKTTLASDMMARGMSEDQINLSDISKQGQTPTINVFNINQQNNGVVPVQVVQPLPATINPNIVPSQPFQSPPDISSTLPPKPSSLKMKLASKMVPPPPPGGGPGGPPGGATMPPQPSQPQVVPLAPQPPQPDNSPFAVFKSAVPVAPTPPAQPSRSPFPPSAPAPPQLPRTMQQQNPFPPPAPQPLSTDPFGLSSTPFPPRPPPNLPNQFQPGSFPQQQSNQFPGQNDPFGLSSSPFNKTLSSNAPPAPPPPPPPPPLPPGFNNTMTAPQLPNRPNFGMSTMQPRPGQPPPLPGQFNNQNNPFGNSTIPNNQQFGMSATPASFLTGNNNMLQSPPPPPPPPPRPPLPPMMQQQQQQGYAYGNQMRPPPPPMPPFPR